MGGCRLRILTKKKDGNWKEILENMSYGYVQVLKNITNGYRSIILKKRFLYEFDGKEYVFVGDLGGKREFQ